MNTIYYQTKTKFTNTGDALINKALIDTLRDYGTLKCNCSKEIPEQFIKELGIKDSEKIFVDGEIGFLREILKDAKKSKKNGDNVYIVSGLGHNYGGSPKKCIRNVFASLIFCVYKIFGVKTIRIGTSIGPISKMLALTEKIRGKVIDYYYVRDTMSLELCHNIGIKNAKLCPDMSWLYDINGKRFSNRNDDICINLKSGGVDAADESKIVEKCEEIVSKLYKDGSTIYFSYQVLEDEAFCKSLYAKFRDRYNCVLIDNQLRLDNVVDVYGKCGYNISNRMHSLLLGYKYGMLPIALIDQEKHTKIQQTMVDSGLEELSIDLYNSSPAEIDNIIENRNRLSGLVFEAERNRQKEIKTILDGIFLEKKIS